MLRYIILSLITVIFINGTLAQVTSESSARVMKMDFSPFLLTNEKYGATGLFDKTNGRLQIHFEKVVKDPTNPMVYHVIGASRHMKQVTPFRGTIKIEDVTFHKGTLDHMLRMLPGIKPEKTRLVEGEDSISFVLVKANYNLREDSTKKFSGMFDGNLTFALRIREDMSLGNDWNRTNSRYFRNFVYQGTWTSYNKKFSAPATWADGRIPADDGVDVGTAEFRIAPKYEKDGWMRDADGNYIDNPEYWWRVTK